MEFYYFIRLIEHFSPTSLAARIKASIWRTCCIFKWQQSRSRARRVCVIIIYTFENKGAPRTNSPCSNRRARTQTCLLIYAFSVNLIDTVRIKNSPGELEWASGDIIKQNDQLLSAIVFPQPIFLHFVRASVLSSLSLVRSLGCASVNRCMRNKKAAGKKRRRRRIICRRAR